MTQMAGTLRRPPCLRADRPCEFASFENSAEVAQWKATGAAAVEPSTDFPSWQTHSLRIFVPAGARGGVETGLIPLTWDRFEALQFFVYAEQPVEISVQLSGVSGTHSVPVTLHKGAQHVQLRLRDFAGIDLTKIDKLTIDVAPQQGPATIFLDRFRLTEYNTVLAKFGRMDAPYGMEVETPHVKWGKPFINGRLHVLIVPDVAHGRAAVELAQRLECRLYPVSLAADSGRNRWGFGDFYGERGDSYGAPFTLAYTYLADQLLNGPQYDVMVLPGSRPWDEFPEIVRNEIRKRVEAGMGLVLLNMRVKDPAKAADLLELSPLGPGQGVRRGSRWEVSGKDYITRNVPLNALPYDEMEYTKATNSGKLLLRTPEGDPILAVKTVGKGRVVAATWEERGLIPLIRNQWQTSATWRYWEYLYSLLARSVVWAAHKEPEGGIEEIQTSPALAPNRVTVRLAIPRGATWSLMVKVRDEHWRTEKSVMKLATAQNEIPLPSIPAGNIHFVDVIVRSKADGKVVDWGTATYRTEPPATITQIRFDSDRFRLGDSVKGVFEIAGTNAAGMRLETRLFDNGGRLLAERSGVLNGAGTIPFSLSSNGVLTRLAWVEGRLIKEGHEIYRKRREVFILQPRKWEDFDVVMYLFGTDPAPGLWDTVQQRLKEMYVTTLSSYPLELSKHANFGVQAQTRISGQESPDGEARIPYLEQKRKYFETKDKKYLARLYCLSDPKYLKQEEEEIRRLVTPWVPFSPMSYYIYEEPSLTCYEDAMDLCFSEHCIARLREWLKQEYGSLDNVNREWGTQFTSWEKVVPDTTEEAQQRNNYASWADHRTFMEKTYAENYAYVRDLLHRHDPDGLVLLSGTQESAPHNGCDYYQIDQIVGHLNPYTGGNQLEFHRSFNPQLRSSAGTGYGVHGRQALYNLYSGLYHGFWAGAYIFWQYSILNPDYRFCQSAQDIRKALAEIQGEGIARMIATARRDNNGIAIHYSYPSIHATWIPDGRVTRPDQNPSVNAGPTGRKFIENRDGWVNVLKDLGYQFDFVARQQIEAGELLRKGFRLLVLPFSVSITDKEIAEIRKFVSAGGVVIADGQAGVMDGHAKWLPHGSLDDLFGIRRPTPVRQKELAASEPDKEIQPSGGKALAAIDGAPALIIHPVDKGKAIYLNFFFNQYVEQRHRHQEGKWKELLRRALDQAGLKPPFTITSAGKPLEGFEAISFRAGGARYLGLLKNDEVMVRSWPLTVHLGTSWHVYDVRNRRYLGFSETIHDTIKTAEPKLYALLPSQVRAVRITPEVPARRGLRFSYKIEVDGVKTTDPVVVVKVYRPDGKLVREYSENILAKAATGVSGFWPALNDPRGAWKVVATEAASGERAVLTFELR